jgi:hypothetical protein
MYTTAHGLGEVIGIQSVIEHISTVPRLERSFFLSFFSFLSTTLTFSHYLFPVWTSDPIPLGQTVDKFYKSLPIEHVSRNGYEKGMPIQLAVLQSFCTNYSTAISRGFVDS